MFYTYTEKQPNSLFGGWRMRVVAFDTRRRYLYYSDRAPEASTAAAAATASPSSSMSPAPSASSSHAGSAVPAVPEDGACMTATRAQVTQLKWTKKMKVFAVTPVATVWQFKLDDPRMAENDLYQLEISGEPRPLATGETPPIGPLLCPSTGLLPMPRRCSVENEAFIEDPFFLKELFNALRDEFEELENARAAMERAAAESGSPVAATTTLTLSSPRPKAAYGALETAGASNGKKEKVVLRCRDEREFRRFWYVLQTVLGYDRLIIRPYRGLPPYDPRNLVSFAHIPMTVWHTFKALDKAVFYIFSRGDVMGVKAGDGEDSMTVDLAGAYVCVTHDMVYFMRDTGNIPRWLRLPDVAEFHYNVTAAQPFFVFLCDPPVPDLIVVPLPPFFGQQAVAQYDPVFEVRRMQRVMHDTCFASLAIRRVIKLTEVQDSSVQAYVRRMRAGGRPLRLQPGPTYSSAMSCPLPKEQLAAVWAEVQEELRAIGDVSDRAAIPLYAESTAADLRLSSGQLHSIALHLEDERERRDDVVGMPLERAQQVEGTEPSTAARARRSGATVPRRRTARPRQAATGTAVASASTQVLPLTAELLHTPQLRGGYQTQEQNASPEESPSQGSSTTAKSQNRSEFSSYVVPGSRYITREEMESGPSDRASVKRPSSVYADNHQEVERGSTVHGAVAPSPSAAQGRGIGGFRYGPERTVNEIVRESMAALHKDPSRSQ